MVSRDIPPEVAPARSVADAGAGALLAPGLLPPGMPAQAVQDELGRVLASDFFHNSERLRRFLRFAVEQVLRGQENKLKEYLIGVEVFDRQESFDPRIDSIVRVEARRLRTKLEQYYEAEGRENPVQIRFRKGSYVPVFGHRQRLGVRRREEAEAGEGRAWRAIAVLPFENLSQDPANQLFADGLTQEVMAALTRLEGLRVAARTSSFQFRERYPDVRRIGEELRVDEVLAGSVRREGERARITAHLIDVEEGYYRWSDSYDCEVRDVFACQEQVAGKILEAVRRKLPVVGEEPAPAEPAESRLAAAVVFEALMGAIPSGEARERARAVAVRVRETNPGTAAASLVAGMALALDWKWAEAEAALTRAIALEPDDALARGVYGVFLSCRGRLVDGLVELRLTEELTPQTALIRAAIGHTLYLRRDVGRAIEQFERALGLKPDFAPALCGLANSYLLKGLKAEAKEAGRRAVERSEAGCLARATLARVLALGGERAEAEHLVGELGEWRSGEVVPLVRLAAALVALGDGERALGLLEEAARERSLELVWLPWDPAFDALREEERFGLLLAGLKPESGGAGPAMMAG
jgi:TolB-like protein/Flp pilus assembly protein TadD